MLQEVPGPFKLAGRWSMKLPVCQMQTVLLQANSGLLCFTNKQTYVALFCAFLFGSLPMCLLQFAPCGFLDMSNRRCYSVWGNCFSILLEQLDGCLVFVVLFLLN